MHISPEQLDALQELMNIGVGRAAGSLNQMLEKPIRLHIPSIRFGKAQDYAQDIPIFKEPTISSVHLPFKGKFSGSASLIFPMESAMNLVTALIGDAEDTDTMDSLREATLTEIGNIVLNGVMGSFANILEEKMIYAVPFYQETSKQELFQTDASGSEDAVLWAQTQFTIEDYDISGNIMLMLGIPEISLLITAINELLDSAKPEYASSRNTPSS